MHPEQSEPSSADVDLIVHVQDGIPMEQVARELRQAGVVVERELPISGVIAIKAPSYRIAELERLAGVKIVRSSKSFQLPPFSEKFPQ